MAYENILKSLGVGSTEDYERKVRNYEVFDRLMKEGADLQEIVDRAKSPPQPAIDEGLFSAMETAVSSDAEVSAARAERDAVAERILGNLYRADAGFRDADKRYRDAVVKAYTGRKGASPEEPEIKPELGEATTGETSRI